MKDRVIFTNVYNEKELLPHWLGYYSKFFEDIIIIDHGSNDGSIETARGKYNITVKADFQHATFSAKDHGNIQEGTKNIQDNQHALFKEYKWVLYAHTDEFLVPNPMVYKDLRDYMEKIDKSDKAYVYANGYEVVQQMGEEKDIDWQMPLLVQRQKWNWAHSYCKPLLSRIPLNWVEGCHYLQEHEPGDKLNLKLVDKELILFHLHRIDWPRFTERSRYYKGENNYGWINRDKDSLKFIPKKYRDIF